MDCSDFNACCYTFEHLGSQLYTKLETLSEGHEYAPTSTLLQNGNYFFQQRAITLKWLILELWLLITALRLIAFYMHTKFKVNRFMGFEVMLRTNTILEYFLE